MATLNSNAEKLAEKAESLPAFSGLKLSHIKDQLEKLLSLIGRDGIFDEYTQHDISHIDKMLGMLDWLIPKDTKEIMSPADWLMTVLAIYFHDLGMLVTKREYDARESSGFLAFRDSELFAGDNGEDYRFKVEKLGADRGERFVYQEFVRSKHAERIRSWIMGQEREHLGISTDAVIEIDKLLSGFSLPFRRDLSLICESHHLNDLDNLNKYKVSQPYGDSDAETVNLQYAAILMRTADLLHITSDRTPSILFRVINPTDPISQLEWVKQQAVTRVRSKIGLNQENIPDENAPRNTIEVHAHFTEEDGFFGLTSYLQYAAEQLHKSYEWVSEAHKANGSRHKFPWRYIDDSHVETEGFIRDTFEFTFDQAKILDLLTGHTLYNDINIVVRELVQNSIDAIRLQDLSYRKNEELGFEGKVKIHWDSLNRILLVEDNGTGMTQNIIERNLLKVGSSRYQGDEFKVEYPDFSPISRFGIGVLSTFMVADSVEILTAHPDNEEARQLSLRSVHGKYLIRLLDKQTAVEAKRMCPHGTQIKLKIRPSIDLSNIVETARRWVVIPNCEIMLIVDDNEPIPIGFSSLKEVVKSYLLQNGYPIEEIDSEKPNIRIIEEVEDEVALAYAVTWSEYFKEWSFLQTDVDDERENLLLGTCVEGIRVEFNTPGYDGYNIIAVSNATGLNAPKTNVVRSGLELTPERDRMLKTIYKLFCKHITREVNEMTEKRSFSLTWAVDESKYLVDPLTSPRNSRIKNMSLLLESITDLPLLLVERDGLRSATSNRELSKEDFFWTIDCASFRSAEGLLREIPKNSSFSLLMKALNAADFYIPEGTLLCGKLNNDELYDLVFSTKEIGTIKVDRSERRIDLLWREKSAAPVWRFVPRNADTVNFEHMVQRDYAMSRNSNVFRIGVAQDAIPIEGVIDEIAIRAFGYTYILPNTLLADYLLKVFNFTDRPSRRPGSHIETCGILFIIQRLVDRKYKLPLEADDLQWLVPELVKRSNPEILSPEFLDVINSTNWKIFDPLAWVRGYN